MKRPMGAKPLPGQCGYLQQRQTVRLLAISSSTARVRLSRSQKVGQDGSLNQTQRNDPHLKEVVQARRAGPLERFFPSLEEDELNARVRSLAKKIPKK